MNLAKSIPKTKSTKMSRKDHSAAVEELLSQAKDLHVLEQVAKINLSGFPHDSLLPSNLETRFRRLKSLPVSSSRNLLTNSKRLASFPDMKNRGNRSSLSASRNLPEKSRPFNTPIVKSRSELGESSNSRRIGSCSSRFSRSGRGDFSVSGKIYSNSSRFSQEVKTFSQTTQTQKLLSKRKSNISSSSLRSSGSTSSSSHKEQKQKSKSKILISWFDKLSLARSLGCLRRSPDISSPNSKRKEELRKRMKIFGEKNSADDKIC